MDINTLKTFIEVYRTRHFGKAADNLFVTQSTVSARIRQLEEQLGVQLFYRDRNNIKLTPSGQKFLKHAESILNVWNKARLDIVIEDENKTPITIGGVPSLWDIYLSRWILGIKNKFPDILIIAEAMSADTLMRQLIDQTIDIGFTYDFPMIPNVIVSDIFSFELIMICSEKNKNVKQAMELDYIFIDWGTSFSIQHASFFPDAPTPSIRTNLGRVAKDIIRKNGGTAYLPEPMVRNDLQKERLFRVKDAPGINRKSVAVYQENSDQRDLIHQMLSLN